MHKHTILVVGWIGNEAPKAVDVSQMPTSDYPELGSGYRPRHVWIEGVRRADAQWIASTIPDISPDDVDIHTLNLSELDNGGNVMTNLDFRGDIFTAETVYKLLDTYDSIFLPDLDGPWYTDQMARDESEMNRSDDAAYGLHLCPTPFGATATCDKLRLLFLMLKDGGRIYASKFIRHPECDRINGVGRSSGRIWPCPRRCSNNIAQRVAKMCGGGFEAYEEDPLYFKHGYTDNMRHARETNEACTRFPEKVVLQRENLGSYMYKTKHYQNEEDRLMKLF